MDTDDGRKLFVGGLPDVISEDDLRQLFEATGGGVVDISLPRDRATGRPRGFAFVTMSSSADAAAARRSLDRSTQAGRTISVREFHADSRTDNRGASGRSEERPQWRERPPAGPGAPAREPAGRPSAGPPGQDKTLYVSNLPYEASREDIEALFAQYGAEGIARVHLPTSPEGRGRGFGFVTMTTTESAEQAVALLRDAELRGRKVQLSIAHPRGERPSGPPGGDRPRFDRGAPPRGDRPGFDRASGGGFERGGNPGGYDRGPGGFDRGAGNFDRGAPPPRELERDRPERRFDDAPAPDRFESFRGGGEDRRRKEREKNEKKKKPKAGMRASRGDRDGRDDPSRWDPDRWDDD